MNRKVATSDSAGTAGTSVETTESSRIKSPGARSSSKTSARTAPGDVGNLLRGAYRQTVDEAIPDDLMDLLNKLE